MSDESIGGANIGIGLLIVGAVLMVALLVATVARSYLYASTESSETAQIIEETSVVTEAVAENDETSEKERTGVSKGYTLFIFLTGGSVVVFPDLLQAVRERKDNSSTEFLSRKPADTDDDD